MAICNGHMMAICNGHMMAICNGHICDGHLTSTYTGLKMAINHIQVAPGVHVHVAII